MGAAPAQKGSGAVVALLAIIAVLLLVGFAGGGYLYWRSSSAAAPVASASATTSGAAPATSAAPTASVAGTPTATAKGKPGTIVDAGAPVAVVDAGAPAPSRKEMGGTKPFIGSMGSSPFTLDEMRAAVNPTMGAVTGCYVQTEFDPPDHQFNFYFINVSPTGQVTGVSPVTDASNHPKLTPCLSNALRGAKFPAKPGGGRPKISFTARTKDNP